MAAARSDEDWEAYPVVTVARAAYELRKYGEACLQGDE